MVTIDKTVLTDPDRLGAVRRVRGALPALPMPLDAVARLAARLLGAPMGQVTLVGDQEEHLIGVHALPGLLNGHRSLPLAYSVCKYIVSADRVVRSGDMLRGDDPALCEHLLATRFGVRAFMGAPVRDGAGRPIGSLTVLDTAARGWTADQTSALLEIAELLRDPAAGTVVLPGAPDPAAGTAVVLRGATPLEPTRVPGRQAGVTVPPILGGDARRLGAPAVATEATALRRAERFRACHLAVEQNLTSAASMVEAAPGILAAVGTTLGWPRAELWLIDEATSALWSVGHWNAPGVDLDELLEHPPAKGAGITGRVWDTGQPMWVPDIADHIDLGNADDRAWAEICMRHGVRTVLAVPVHDAGALLGVLTCFAGSPEYHEDLLTVLLDGVAAQIGGHVALRRAEELARQLTRAKDDFLALVGHEIRTPLTSIVANAAMLGEDVAGLDEESRGMLGAVLRNATALRDVVDALLDLAGLDSGCLPLAVRRVDLASIVADAVEGMRERAAAAGVRLGAVAGAPVWLDGDVGRLRQVVDNLVGNAVAYSPPGGTVRVELRRVADTAELRVIDEGIGIPAAERDRLFDRFYRGSNVRHQGTPGNGLGLSLARTIVQRHGGTIRLSDRRPRGTVALVRLPC